MNAVGLKAEAVTDMHCGKVGLSSRKTSATAQGTLQQLNETLSRLTNGKISLQRYLMFVPVSQVGSSKAESAEIRGAQPGMSSSPSCLPEAQSQQTRTG